MTHYAAPSGQTLHRASRVLRVRDGHEAKVTYEELFFDLVYVFAVTQLSHYLLGNLSLLGAAQTLLLWFAVWLGWQYTGWVTNWFDPRTRPVRLMLFGIMGLGLVLAASLPGAFADRGLGFALSYIGIQLGRSVYVLWMLGPSHALTPNFRRITGWTAISAAFWLIGAFAEGPARMGWWALAVVAEYVSPMIGFRLPGLGASRSSDWTIEGGHLAERCQLFVIVALGESVLLIGATFASTPHLDLMTVLAVVFNFIGSLSMWWLYFDTSSHDGSHVIAHSDDPGRIGAYFHYVHVILIAGIIVAAVGNELVIAHPHGHMTLVHAIVLVGSPLIYLLGNALYKRVVYGRFPKSHLLGVGLLVLLCAVSPWTDLLWLSALTTVVVLIVAAMDSAASRRAKLAHAGAI